MLDQRDLTRHGHHVQAPSVQMPLQHSVPLVHAVPLALQTHDPWRHCPEQQALS